MLITWKGSPNKWANRILSGKQYKPNKIVIHWFGSGTIESANARFQNPASQVSAHYGISQGRVWCWVKEQDAAWHGGSTIVNLESIGIEHDANPDKPLSEMDYRLSGELVAEISKRWAIPLDRQHVIGHREVKATKCPGSIDIDKILQIAREYLNPGPVLPMRFSAVKRKGVDTIYAVAGESLFPFNGADAFLNSGGDFAKVTELEDVDFYKYSVLNDTVIDYIK